MLKRAVEVDRGLPVIVVARCLDMGSHVEAMQLGTTGYLVEPLAAWELGRMLLPHPRFRECPAVLGKFNPDPKSGYRSRFRRTPLGRFCT